MTGRGVYVHLPFCISKCNYCTFNSRVAQKDRRDEYLKALLVEIESLPHLPGDTVYFGGGTPTIYPPSKLAGLLDALDSALDIDADAEISVEANPETVDEQDLNDLNAAGFNRISIGVQSFRDGELKLLGRAHTAARARRVITAARGAEFNTVSIDLIRNLPGQSLTQFQYSINQAISLEPDHISVYGLSVDSGTPLGEMIESGEVRPPQNDDASWVRWTVDRLNQAGYRRYEISNYARPKHRCRHNLHYWRNEEYLGVGAGACSYLNEHRRKNVEDPKKYCAAIQHNNEPVAEEEQLNRYRTLGETMMLGLRMVDGISRNRIIRRFRIDPYHYYDDTIQHLVDADLMVQDGDRIRLTFRGLLVQSSVAGEFLPAPQQLPASATGIPDN